VLPLRDIVIRLYVDYVYLDAEFIGNQHSNWDSASGDAYDEVVIATLGADLFY
jgi:hypothetical protein